MPKNPVTVRVPASTSNLGPGYDCLGVALRLYNAITVARTDEPSPPSVVDAAAQLFFRAAKVRPFRFGWSATDHVPRSRGLGSSATVRIGFLLALNRLAGDRLKPQQIFELAAALENHPDNAAPAMFGGFTVVRDQTVQRFQVSPRLRFVFLVPALEVHTWQARQILPARIPRLDAVESSRNAATITAAFASRNYRALQGAFGDGLHQAYRKRLIPFLPRVIAAAEKAGALGAFLSGSGSTIGALTLESPRRVGDAMKRAAGGRGSGVIITSADNLGARFVAGTARTR